MLSTSAKYAIRAVEFLLDHSTENKRIRAIEISIGIAVPQPYLSKILQDLSKGDIISSAKGPNGGFYLNKANKEKSLWDVVVCIDGIAEFNKCYMGTPNCDANNPCSLHDLALEFRTSLINNLKGRRVDRLGVHKK
ncbi:MAG: transcriptional regulator [Flavobacteriales bacterium]|nr:transcriptional regulator [Flavobacteriales bacterium]|tara:strand:- start:897 stop:1304 length:408 start_codon:yes stop_codon:yes gene_type:complete